MTTLALQSPGQEVNCNSSAAMVSRAPGKGLDESADTAADPQDTSNVGQGIATTDKPGSGFVEFLTRIKNSDGAKWFANTITAYDRSDATTGEKAGKFLLDTTIGAGTGAIIVASGGTAVTVGSTLLGAAVLGATGGFLAFSLVNLPVVLMVPRRAAKLVVTAGPSWVGPRPMRVVRPMRRW